MLRGFWCSRPSGPEYVFGALRAGASGFLLKDALPESLIVAVHTIARGDSLLDPAVTRAVVERFGRTAELDAGAVARLAQLSEREREVLLLLVEGCANREIASRLFISEATVKMHVMAVLRKLDLRDRIQAVILGLRVGPGDTGPVTQGRWPRQVPPSCGAVRWGAVPHNPAPSSAFPAFVGYWVISTLRHARQLEEPARARGTDPVVGAVRWMKPPT